MLNSNHVVIGIQARSGSTRFPRKVFEMIGDKSMLRHIIDTCDNTSFYINRMTHKTGIRASFAVVCPYDDEIGRAFSSRATIIHGPEEDVLSRYKKMADRMQADYVVRVTSDCPLLPSYLISKHIKIAIANKYDYLSNVDERIRTSVDGHDVEVISVRALEWADQNAKDQSDREHVTTILRRQGIPEDFRIGHTIGFVNFKDIKLSVDTQEDLERVRSHYRALQDAVRTAYEITGQGGVHRV